jgi:23S rRNA (adenine1618-N6)-methyltransferase
MLPAKKEHPKKKDKLHPRNKHRERYDFKQLISSCAELKPFVSLNKYVDESIDFFNPQAVKALNKALLVHFYGIQYWDIPDGYLCPPIPGRADYIHHIADVLGKLNGGKIPEGPTMKVLDIGVGANCIYPIIGTKEYGWSFVGSEIDSIAADSANSIINKNEGLSGVIDIRLQKNTKEIFNGIITANEHFDLTLCNPPFHASLAEAKSGTLRKLKNLKQKKVSTPVLNFGGQTTELWCDGGESQFVSNMIQESEKFTHQCLWFSTLISKESNLKHVYFELRKVKATEVKTIEMGQGNKVSRIVAWTFLTKQEQKDWNKRK